MHAYTRGKKKLIKLLNPPLKTSLLRVAMDDGPMASNLQTNPYSFILVGAIPGPK